jgi:thioredoxin
MKIKEQLKTGRLLVDFYADWCGPCKTLEQQIIKYKEEVTDVEVIKINIDIESDLATKYNIRSIPTLLYMVDGEIEDRTSGLKSVGQLKEFTKTQ